MQPRLLGDGTGLSGVQVSSTHRTGTGTVQKPVRNIVQLPTVHTGRVPNILVPFAYQLARNGGVNDKPQQCT